MAGEKKSADNFEAMLRRELRSAPAASTADCVGPEVLAAYYDRILSQAERNNVESHLASCPRCLSMTASIARADDSAAERPREQAESARAFFWLTRVIVPTTAVGIVIAIAFGIRNREQPKPEVIALAAPSVSQKLELAERAPAAPPAFETGSLNPQAPSIAAPPVAGTSNPISRAEASIRNEVAAKHSVAVQHKNSAEQFSVGPVSPAISAGAGVTTSVPRAAPEMAQEAAPTRDHYPPVPKYLPFKYLKPEGIYFSTPNARDTVSWHVGNKGLIMRQRGSDSWVFQTSGVTTDLLDGSAPSSSVCWVVGRSGTILRTIDSGEHWQALKPPSTQDLIAISAGDAKHATVTAEPGVRFSTRDGGVTWSSP